MGGVSDEWGTVTIVLASGVVGCLSRDNASGSRWMHLP